MNDQPKDNSLRGRIATAIWEELRTQNNLVNFDRLADAVIRNLGLIREDRLHLDGSVAYSRYVTGPVAGD